MYVFRSDPLGAEVRSSCKLPMQVLGTELRCSGRTVHALNHQAISNLYIFLHVIDVHHFCAEHSVARIGYWIPWD